MSSMSGWRGRWYGRRWSAGCWSAQYSDSSCGVHCDRACRVDPPGSVPRPRPPGMDSGGVRGVVVMIDLSAEDVRLLSRSLGDLCASLLLAADRETGDQDAREHLLDQAHDAESLQLRIYRDYAHAAGGVRP